MRYVCLFAFLSFAFCHPAVAFQSRVIRAEVSCHGCRSYTGMILEVEDSHHRPVDSTPLTSTGAAEIRGVGEGNYYVTVRNTRGDVIHSDVLAIHRDTERARIELAGQPEAERPAWGGVSLRRLTHKVPKAAQKELKQASKKLRSGDVAGSIVHLKKAIEIDPEYMEAHNNLGTSYIQADDPASALDSFRRAAALEPSLAEIQVNIAIALMTLKDYPEAERAARRAVELNAGDVKARLLLGLALYQQRKYTAETVDQFRRVEKAFPNAKIALAATYAHLGDPMRARKVLEDYLRSGEASKREQALALLAALPR